MTVNEVADMVMNVLAFDDLEKRIVEVEAGTMLNEVEIDVEGGQRFRIVVEEIAG